MHFALLVSDLPHVDEARAYYDSLLTLRTCERRDTAPLRKWWTALRAQFY
jgi:hypothetical protein